MSFFINVMRDSIYKGERVEKSDWENESGPPHDGYNLQRGGGEGRGRALGERRDG